MDCLSKIYSLKLANKYITIRIHFKENYVFLRDYLGNPVDDAEPVELGPYEESVIKRDYSEKQRGFFSERKILPVLVSDALLPFDRFIFHSVAFLLNGKAWLLAAPSGVGKTTLYLNLKKIYPENVKILCGDNPVIHIQQDGVIMVYPSPWNGKERFGSNETGALKGIILLEQARVNNIIKMEKHDAVVPLFHQFNTFLKNEEQIRQLFQLERRLINSVPVMKFQNTGDQDSARMLFQNLV